MGKRTRIHPNIEIKPPTIKQLRRFMRDEQRELESSYRDCTSGIVEDVEAARRIVWYRAARRALKHMK